jgi:hypothetical protein
MMSGGRLTLLGAKVAICWLVHDMRWDLKNLSRDPDQSGGGEVNVHDFPSLNAGSRYVAVHGMRWIKSKVLRSRGCFPVAD